LKSGYLFCKENLLLYFFRFVEHSEDEEVFASERVLYYGQAVGLIVANTKVDLNFALMISLFHINATKTPMT
jgi:hypothetical protein